MGNDSNNEILWAGKKKPSKIEQQQDMKSFSKKLKYDCERINAHDKERAHIYMEPKAAAIERARTGIKPDFDKTFLTS